MEVDLLPVEVYLLPMEISVEVGGFTSLEVSESLHGSKWKFPLSVEVIFFTASINGRFPEYMPLKLPWVYRYPSTYYHEHHNLPVASRLS